ncbi:MAG: hypothetical protein J07AB43_02570 [Candidatus Nanosalina sp. J07AB43]|nr:MAG: hypothetical protein J07AB43_02570 [Candidatus Nanosalina sp. J07AB43]
MRRPLADKRPIGPFLASNNDSVDYIDTNEVDFDNRDWEKLEENDVSDPCVPYVHMSPPIEIIIPMEQANPVALIDYPVSDKEIFEIVSNINSRNQDLFIGIHEADSTDAQRIMEDGYSKSKLGENTISNNIDFRENGIYTWHTIWDLHNTYGDMAGVVTTSTRDNLVASDMAASVTMSPETYKNKYSMPYKQYIQCLREYGATVPIGFEEDIIQDIPQSI